MRELNELRERLERVIRPGLSTDAKERATQIAQIASVLYEAFRTVGLRCTLVGGSAIEVFAPGVYKTQDLDLVIEPAWMDRLRERIHEIFQALGFNSSGRHWIHHDVFVEVPSHELAGPGEEISVGGHVFRIVKKEKLLADRIVGFKQWGYTGYGQQAIDMIAAFGSDLDMSWLRRALETEDSYDAYVELERIAQSDEPVTAETLETLQERLKRR